MLSTDINRRTFLATIAAGALAASRPTAQERKSLTIYFTGLSFFSHDIASRRMTVGLLGNGHETIVIARKADVAQNGRAVTTREWEQWNAIGLGANSSDVTCWKSSALAMSLTSSDPLTVGPLNLFPLTDLANGRAEGFGAKCQSVLSFSAGSFSGHQRFHRCGHDLERWDIANSLEDPNPVRSGLELWDTVKYECSVGDPSFQVGSALVPIVGTSAVLWVLQLPKFAFPSNPRESKHCQMYYDLIDGYQGSRPYPRRSPLPVGCETLAGGDPVYCMPAS